MNFNTPLVVSASEASQRLGISVSTLAKLRLYGKGPAYYKLGRRVVYRIEDLSNWINEHRYCSTSEYSREPSCE